MLALGDAHHVANDADRKRRGEVRDKVTAALFGDFADDFARGPVDVFIDFGQLARRKPGGDEFAETMVTRIIHIDHAPEEFQELGRQIRDAGGPLGGRE